MLGMNWLQLNEKQRDIEVFERKLNGTWRSAESVELPWKM
jgi:hypothetical protein